MAFCLSPGVVKKRPKVPPHCISPRRQCGSTVLCSVQSVETYIQDAVLSLLPSESSVEISEATIAPGQHNEHFRVETHPGGTKLMCKVSRRGGFEAFKGEADSLRLLDVASADDLFVPQALSVGTIDSGLRAYSIFPWVDYAPFGSAIPSVQDSIGRALARLHMRSAAEMGHIHEGRFGFMRNTWLGGIAQENSWSQPGDWTGFFVEHRLRPRLEAAAERFGESAGYGTSNESVLALSTIGERVCSSEMMEYLFSGVIVKPSLVHGDLFMGNCGSFGPDRQPAYARIYDPAAYFAHDELDLALSTMWGRFSQGFYDAYHSERGPPQPRFEARQELYRLYYLLSMLVLHGPGFGAGGSVENPNGYFERCVDCLTKLEEHFQQL